MDNAKTIYYTGIIALTALSILGMIYISKSVYSKECDNTDTEKNISRFTVVILWMLICWILFGSIIQAIWFKSIFV